MESREGRTDCYNVYKGVEYMSVRTISDMVDRIENNIEDTPTIERMANHVGYSECYCSTMFHEYMGIPFKV